MNTRPHPHARLYENRDGEELWLWLEDDKIIGIWETDGSPMTAEDLEFNQHWLDMGILTEKEAD